LNWVEQLRYNPLNSLLKIDDKLIQYHIKRELIENRGIQYISYGKTKEQKGFLILNKIMAHG
jgi:hypothetical protein